jgi:hypothetical protein
MTRVRVCACSCAPARSYYRTMAVDVHTGPESASAAAEAFRFVAAAWLQSRSEVRSGCLPCEGRAWL